MGLFGIVFAAGAATTSIEDPPSTAIPVLLPSRVKPPITRTLLAPSEVNPFWVLRIVVSLTCARDWVIWIPAPAFTITRRLNRQTLKSSNCTPNQSTVDPKGLKIHIGGIDD